MKETSVCRTVRMLVPSNAHDMQYSISLCTFMLLALFEAAAYEPDFELVEDEDSQSTLKMPDGVVSANTKEWAASLPEEYPNTCCKCLR